MTDAAYELMGDGATVDAGVVDAGVVPLRWPVTHGTTDTVLADVGWGLGEVAGVPDAAVDLVRIAAGAYMADRLTQRGSGFTRRIALAVAVTDTGRWADGAADDLERLLSWLTGDLWHLAVVQDEVPVAEPLLEPEHDAVPTSLLSGGLDSFLGAIELLRTADAVRFLGHKDAAPSVKAAQTRVEAWLGRSYTPAPSYTRVALRQAARKREPSSRSRSLLFAALGIAASSASGAATLYVPENGYTSINAPLHANRGGALSTRSTHPETFRRLDALVDRLGLGVVISNPFADMTKGEALRHVAASSPPAGWLDTAAGTLSCSKLDGNWNHGDPNLNCGLCVSCLVRRGTFIAAGQPDRTVYLVNALTGTARDELIVHRRSDIEAVRYAVAAGVDDDQIDSGTWPPDQDLDAVADLIGRGLAELAAVPLP